MQPYPTVQNYNQYQQSFPQPYPDRLTQLQNQYQQAVNVPQIQTIPQPQVNQGLLWVSGEVGAKSYLVAPNSTVLLMDSDDAVFYLKSADSAGLPTLRTFSYVEIESNQNKQKSSEVQKEFVDREEFELFKNEPNETVPSPLTAKPELLELLELLFEEDPTFDVSETYPSEELPLEVF